MVGFLDLDTVFVSFVFLLGCFVGFLVSFVFKKKMKEESDDYVGNLISQQKDQQKLLMDSYLSELKSSFREESLDNLQRSTETSYKLTSEKLEENQKAIKDELFTNRGAIEKNISLMLEKVSGLGELIHKVETKTGENYGELGALLKQTNEQTKSLVVTTSAIKKVLSNSQTRGFWGEKLAEDILRYSGFVENIHYKKQMTLSSGNRPDFTFLLPDGLNLHMDVKFPLENYKNYLESQDSPAVSKKYEKLFISDVKVTIKSLLSRSYMDPDTTVGCVLLFIPHEDVLAFIQQKSEGLIEECLRKQLILCSPMSLLSILMVVKKAVDVFKVQKTSQDLISYMHNFKKQWNLYTSSFEGLGKKIRDLESDYEKLTGTRTRMLGSVVDKITNLSPKEDSLKEG